MKLLDAISEALTSWAERNSELTRDQIAQAYVEGHEDGQEYERLRGSRPSA